MGLINNLIGGDNPTLQTVDLDNGTKKLMDEQYKRAVLPKDQLAGEVNQGVKEAGNSVLQSNEQVMRQAAATGQNPAMLQAIRNQYRGVAGQDINRIVKRNEMNVDLNRQKSLHDATGSAMAKSGVETQNYVALQKAMADADLARTEVLASVLGIGGMGLGAYMARGHAPPHKANVNAFNSPESDITKYEKISEPGYNEYGEGNFSPPRDMR